MTCEIFFEEKRGKLERTVELSDNFFFRNHVRETGRLLNLSKVLEKEKGFFSDNGVRSGVKPFLRDQAFKVGLGFYF